MKLIPGWDSIPGAALWSTVFFWCAIASLLCLALFAVASHRYAERRDELAAIDNRETQRRLTEDIARLTQAAGQQTAEADAARAQIAEAEARAAEANRHAEEDRLARIKIEDRLAPRNVSGEQFLGLVAALSKLPGAPVAIWSAGAAPEIGAVSRTILLALQAASWEAHVWTWTGVGPIAGIAVLVQHDADAATVEAASTLNAALNAAGLQSVPGAWPAEWRTVGGGLNGPPNPTDPKIRVIVGAKLGQ